MFTLTPTFKEAMQNRLANPHVNARLLVIASGIAFDEIPLPIPTNVILSRGNETLRLVVSNTLGERAQNVLYAKALAHILLHHNRFAPNTVWSDNPAMGLPSAFARADIQENHERAAAHMAIEILVPTIALREAFLYHQGNLADMAAHFNAPKSMIHIACVRHGLLHPNAAVSA